MNEICISELVFYHTFSIFYRNKPNALLSLQKGSQQTYAHIKQTCLYKLSIESIKLICLHPNLMLREENGGMGRNEPD